MSWGALLNDPTIIYAGTSATFSAHLWNSGGTTATLMRVDVYRDDVKVYQQTIPDLAGGSTSYLFQLTGTFTASDVGQHHLMFRLVPLAGSTVTTVPPDTVAPYTIFTAPAG